MPRKDKRKLKREKEAAERAERIEARRRLRVIDIDPSRRPYNSNDSNPDMYDNIHDLIHTVHNDPYKLQEYFLMPHNSLPSCRLRRRRPTAGNWSSVIPLPEWYNYNTLKIMLLSILFFIFGVALGLALMSDDKFNETKNRWFLMISSRMVYN